MIFPLSPALLLRPPLEDCVQLWAPHQEGDTDIVQRVQQGATEMAKGLERRSHKGDPWAWPWF